MWRADRGNWLQRVREYSRIFWKGVWYQMSTRAAMLKSRVVLCSWDTRYVFFWTAAGKSASNQRDAVIAQCWVLTSYYLEIIGSRQSFWIEFGWRVGRMLWVADCRTTVEAILGNGTDWRQLQMISGGMKQVYWTSISWRVFRATVNMGYWGTFRVEQCSCSTATAINLKHLTWTSSKSKA